MHSISLDIDYSVALSVCESSTAINWPHSVAQYPQHVFKVLLVLISTGSQLLLKLCPITLS